MSTTDMQVIPPNRNPPPLRKLVSLHDLWNVFVSTKPDLAAYSKMHYGIMGRHFCAFMENRKLEPMAMVEWVQHQIKLAKAGNNRINESNVKVKAFLKWLKKMNYISTDLWESVTLLPRKPVASPQIFTEEDYQKIKAFCKDRDGYQPHLWLVILSYHTGMSLVDCCHLRWRNVHLNDDGPSYIDIYRTKVKRLGEKALCQIPIIPFTDLHEWLLKLKKVPAVTKWHQRWIDHYEGMVDFVHEDCPGLYSYTNQRLARQFEDIFRQSGVCKNKEKTFRHLRNTFCSNLVNSGAQLALICKMTGHNNVQTLLKYLKADRVSMQDGLNKAFEFAKEGSTQL